MDKELYRLSTYNKFSLSYPVHPLRLAQAGFYYEGKEDEVVCFMCKLKHRAWKKEDDPFVVHMRLSPECQYIKHHPKTMLLEQQNTVKSHVSSVNISSQIPIASGGVSLLNNGSSSSSTNNNTRHQQTSNSHAESSVTRHPCDTVGVSESGGGVGIHNAATLSSPSISGSSNKDIVDPSNKASTKSRVNNIPALQNMGISTARPRYSSYAILSVRESSYRNWPLTLRQQPQELAKAGFFYEGKSDHVRCFFCGGGLKDWEPEDDPWIEHARWFPKCVFVHQCKGENFVYSVLTGMKDIVQNNQQISTRQEEDPAILSVIEMGYKPELVRKIFSSLNHSKGTDHISADLLLQALWDLEDSGIENDVTEEELKETPMSVNYANGKEKIPHKTIDEIHLSGEAESAIQEENRTLKEMKTCKICLDEDASIVFLPCGHLVSCASCAPALTKCPICRAHIKGTVKAILS